MCNCRSVSLDLVPGWKGFQPGDPTQLVGTGVEDLHHNVSVVRTDEDGRVVDVVEAVVTRNVPELPVVPEVPDDNIHCVRVPEGSICGVV